MSDVLLERMLSPARDDESAHVYEKSGITYGYGRLLRQLVDGLAQLIKRPWQAAKCSGEAQAALDPEMAVCPAMGKNAEN